MKALVQRVSEAGVSAAGRAIAATGPGLMVLFCAERGDDAAKAQALAHKIAKLRIFDDAAGKMNLSLLDRGGDALVVSQFTLAADVSRGNRPGFSRAAPPALAEACYERFCDGLRACGVAVQTGEFGARMAVRLVNDGPVTLWIDAPP